MTLKNNIIPRLSNKVRILVLLTLANNNDSEIQPSETCLFQGEPGKLTWDKMWQKKVGPAQGSRGRSMNRAAMAIYRYSLLCV